MRFTPPPQISIWDFKTSIKKFFDKPTIGLLAISILFGLIYAYFCKSITFHTVIQNSLALFFFLRIKGWIRIPVLLFASFIFTINATSVKLYGGQIQEGMLASAIETNYQEAGEFISFAGFFPYFILVLTFSLLFICSRNAQKLGWKGAIFLIILLCYPAVKKVILPTILYSASERKVSREFREFPIERLAEPYQKNYLLREPMMIAQYFSVKHRLDELSQMRHSLPNGISEGTFDGPKRIVIIFGETDAKLHHGIYGYPYPTDLFMMRQQQKAANTAIFNAISSAPITRESVFRVFSLATSRKTDPLFENVNLVELAKNAGYETNWISRQASVGVEVYNRLISARADYLQFITSGLDDVLIEPFARQLNNNKKQLFVLHLYGSHLQYKQRHDKDDFIRAEKSPEPFRHYDASIGHTDRVLEAINRYKDNNTLFVYLPDHGELINKGHGFPYLYDKQFEVPFFAWSDNSALIKKFRNIVEKNSIESGTLFNTASLTLVMAEMMGYRVSEGYRQQALEDSKFIFNVDGKVYPVSALKPYDGN